MLGAFAIDRTLTSDTERTRLARSDVMSTHFDLQPAVAARRAGSTGSQVSLGQVKRPVIDPGCSLNKIANARKPNLARLAVALRAVVSNVERARAPLAAGRKDPFIEARDKRGFVVHGARQMGWDTCSAYRTIDIHSGPTAAWLRYRIRGEPFVRRWPGEQAVDRPRNSAQTQDSHLTLSVMFPIARDSISRPPPSVDPQV